MQRTIHDWRMHLKPDKTLEDLSRMFNPIIRGWVNYYGRFYKSELYSVLRHLNRALVAALEGASHGITVNALCPGYVDTPLVRNQLSDLARIRKVDLERVLEEVIYPLVPQRRLLSVEEIADYATFLASDKLRGVTGQAVILDGGYTAQ